MNKNKWLAALAVIAVLAVAFFWGGNYPKPDAERQSAVWNQEAGGSDGGLSEAGAPGEEAAVEGAAPDPGQSGNEALGTESADACADAAERQADTDACAKESGTPNPADSAEGGSGSSAAESGSDGNEQAAGSAAPDASEPATAKPEQSGGGKPEPTPAASGKPGAEATKTPVKTNAPKASAAPNKPTDNYLTEPVPEGKPEPVEWQDTEVDKKQALTATLSVSAATILNHLDMFDEDKLEVLPKDGIIFKAREVTFYEGESVFDVLLREMKKAKIHMEFEMTPVYNSNYIEGINNIYEFDCGELSGWMYKVNSWFPNYGSSRYLLQDGDVIEWVYTCDLGRDVGGDNSAAGKKP